MKTVILGNFADMQSAIYILESMYDFCSDVVGIDIRRIVSENDASVSQNIIRNEIDDLPIKPDLILVLKGLEMTPETLKWIEDKFPDAKLVNWFFDKYLQDKALWESKEYLKTLSSYDYFFCSLKGVADKLNEMGYNNAKYLDEACHPNYNGEQYCNFYQEKKYGEDISFAGSLGYTLQHPKRIPTLAKLIREGFKIKIWGDIVCEWKLIPTEIKDSHMQTCVINENHSRVVKTSLINLGIDQDIDVDMGHSARLYRVMCAGGLYLTNATKGLDEMFKVNKEGEEITGEEELVIYYNDDDLIEKLDFLLEHNEIREKIAKNGQKVVLEKHKFTDRIEEMLKIIKKVE